MVATVKPKTYLYDVSFDFEETEDCLGPHIALTFDFQGGAASGYNTPLLFKLQDETLKPIFKSKAEAIKPELILKLKEIGVDTSTLEKEKPVKKTAINPDVYARIREMLEEMQKANKPAPVKEPSLTDKLIQIMKNK